MAALFNALGLGKFGKNGHPIHPSTVHWPLAFLSTAYGLDGLTMLIRKDIISVRSIGTFINDLPRVSFYCHILGVLTALPAAATGIAELYAMISSKGIWQKIQRKSDKETVYSGMNPTVRIGLLHAIANDVALATSVHAIWARMSTRNFDGGDTAVLMSALMLPALMWSGYLGGSLVYEYGVGVQRMGTAKQIKDNMQQDEVEGFDGQTQLLTRKEQ